MTRHAYLILAHDNPEVLDFLLDSIDDERNDIFLHIDAKSVSMQRHYEQRRLRHGRLLLIPDPVCVYWGHTSQIEAELRCLQAARSQGKSYARYHLLSGVDMPIKTQDEIHGFFSEHPHTECIGYWQTPEHERDALKKVRYHYIFNRHKRSKGTLRHNLLMPIRNLALLLQKAVGLRRSLSRNKVKKGFQWFSITEALCDYVLSQSSQLLHDYRRTLCPDEIFLQTLVWHSPFRSRLYDPDDAQRGSMRAIDWERGHPYVWQADEAHHLVHECPLLFARKCDIAVARAIAKELRT